MDNQYTKVVLEQPQVTSGQPRGHQVSNYPGVLTLFLPALGGISPYMSIMWQQPVGIGLSKQSTIQFIGSYELPQTGCSGHQSGFKDRSDKPSRSKSIRSLKLRSFIVNPQRWPRNCNFFNDISNMKLLMTYKFIFYIIKAGVCLWTLWCSAN
jgi:hypothetical protein